MHVTYFRSFGTGPEFEIENAVAQGMPALFPSAGQPVWVAGSLPVGAGIPDLLFVKLEPAVLALANVELADARILAYLRAVGRARAETIVRRLGRSHVAVEASLESLVEARAVTHKAHSFSLAASWRTILPEVIAIEAKVANWRSAVRQAARNRIFSHRSFVALPEQVATRVALEPLFAQLGIGVLSVTGDGEVTEVRRAAPLAPRVWSYYYRIALLAARHAYTE